MIPPISVSLLSKFTGSRPYVDPNFGTFGTVAFEFDFMLPLFVIGRVRRDANGVIVLSDETHPRPIIDPAPVLDCSLWQTVVPEIYALDAERAIRAVGPEFEGIKGTLDVIPRFVECLRRWIGSNVEPRGRFGYSYPIGEP